MKPGEDYIGVSVIFFCHDGAGKFLMGKRSERARDEQGRWDIGGGKIELGENMEDTLKREIQEEYSTDILQYELLGFREVHRKNDGKPTHWITFDYKVLVDPKKVTNGEPRKFTDVQWFTLDSYPKNCHSQFPAFLKLHKGKL